jgi:hypothetical protein
MVIKIHKSKDKQCNGQNKQANNAMAKIKTNSAMAKINRQTILWPNIVEKC